MSLDITHLGAFLSGIAAVLSSTVAIRRIRRRADADCKQRIEEVKQAIREGFQLRDE